jgi:hypothetical protein
MNIYWKGTVPSGSFTSAGNWVQSSVPGISDIVELTTGATVTVSTGAPVTVLGVNLALGTLLINTDFTATEGTAIGSNQGTIEVNNGAQFSVGGTVKNVNVINVNNGGTPAVDDFDLTVNGGGLIGLGGDGATLVVSAGRTLVNVDNTIAGQGTIIDAGMLVNHSSGIIEVTHSSGTLFLDIATRNQWTIEAIDLLGASRLQINGSVINNTGGGVIRAVGSSTVGIGTDSTIIGGTVTAQSAGTLLITGTNVTFDGGKSVIPTNTMITIKGDVDLNPDAVLNLKGTINNSGSIDAGGSGTLIVQPSGTNSMVTLKGSGTIDIGDHAAQITGGGSAVTFDNVNNKINGGGKIGGAGLTLRNEVGGTIDANDGTLIIDTAANAITNAGALNAGAGTLVIASNLSNTGKLNADNGMVYVVGKAAGGTAIISGLGSAALEFGAAASTATKFAVGTTGQLILADSAEYTGVISGFGGNTTQSIDLADFNLTGAHASSFSLGVLTLKNTAGQVVHLHFSGTHTLASFHLSNDGNFNGTDDGTKITDPPAPTKPQSPLSDPLASLFGQFMASWNPITALTSEMHAPLASELQMATNLLHAHG